MSIDLKTASVEPIRRTFDHIEAKLGPDKNPTRYQEATWGLQPFENQHYRPTWEPTGLLYDPRRTAIVMEDFDDLVDPRQYYYGTWTIQRGKQQDSQEKNFDFVEKRNLLQAIAPEWQKKIRELVIPMRHVAWAGNTNNNYIAAYGFGAPITSGCTMHMMDLLGVAQYISRIGLVLAENEPAVLDQARQEWVDAPLWQPLRALVEDSMVTRDWFELFVVQNLIIDGTVYPLVFDRFDSEIGAHGGAGFSMLCEFIGEWSAESRRWVDAVIKRAIQESDDNRQQIAGWLANWTPRVQGAVQPLAEYVFNGDAATCVDSLFDDVHTRATKCGVAE